MSQDAAKLAVVFPGQGVGDADHHDLVADERPDLLDLVRKLTGRRTRSPASATGTRFARPSAVLRSRATSASVARTVALPPDTRSARSRRSPPRTPSTSSTGCASSSRAVGSWMPLPRRRQERHARRRRRSRAGAGARRAQRPRARQRELPEPVRADRARRRARGGRGERPRPGPSSQATRRGRRLSLARDGGGRGAVSRVPGRDRVPPAQRAGDLLRERGTLPSPTRASCSLRP